MKTIELAKQLLAWNKKNLVANALLNKSEISDYFADSFQVKANGRVYDANMDNYYDFLNQFRATIHSIDYDVHDIIANEMHAVVPATAHITRVDGTRETFEAILILKFNHEYKITLWHEVYIKV